MSTFQHVVEVFLSVDRPTFTPTPEWVAYRLNFFHQWTLNSILAQSVKDFLLFVHCGERYRYLTEAYPWHPAARVVYDWGKKEYEKIDAEFLVTTRIDSDDLLRTTALEAIRPMIRKGFAEYADRKVYVMREGYLWDQLNGWLIPYYKKSASSFSHVFPRRVYKDWDRFAALHLQPHGSKWADKDGVELPGGLFCIIKHGPNTSLVKIGQRHERFSDAERKRVLATPGCKTDPALISRVLAGFGVSPS